MRTSVFAATVFLGIFLVVLPGCGSQPVIEVPREVKVLVPTPCLTQRVERPTMPLDDLTGAESVLDLAKKALAELEIRIGYELKLEAAQDACLH